MPRSISVDPRRLHAVYVRATTTTIDEVAKWSIHIYYATPAACMHMLRIKSPVVHRDERSRSSRHASVHHHIGNGRRPAPYIYILLVCALASVLRCICMQAPSSVSSWQRIYSTLYIACLGAWLLLVHMHALHHASISGPIRAYRNPSGTLWIFS